jgi:hypothetical protein
MASFDKWQHTSNSLDNDMSTDNEILSEDRFWGVKDIFGGAGIRLYMMGLGQGNRAAPPSWIQLSAVLVNVFKQLELGALMADPITQELIHSMGTLFVDDTDLYTWKDGLLDPGELWLQTQLELTQWSTLLNATGEALKPEKCFWYMLDHTCEDGEWSNAEMTPRQLFVTNSDSTKSQINQEEVTVSKKTLGIHELRPEEMKSTSSTSNRKPHPGQTE